MNAEDRPPEDETYRKVDLRSTARSDSQPPSSDSTSPEARPPDTGAAAASEIPAEPAAEAAAENGSEAPSVATAADQPPTDDSAEPALDTVGILRFTLSLLIEQAWVQMGVQLAPGATEVTTDLRQARLAIDTVQHLREVLQADLTAEESRYLDQTLSTLRLNFVQRS